MPGTEVNGCEGSCGSCGKEDREALYKKGVEHILKKGVEHILKPALDLTKCPACKHDKHIGRVCGAEVDVTASGDGMIEPVRCSCHEEARKASTGKCKGYHLLPWDALEELARVYEYGAKKYAPNSWRDVPNAIEEYTNAMFRHIRAVSEGRVWDEEAAALGFKIRHQSMVLWNAAAVTALTQKRDNVS